MIRPGMQQVADIFIDKLSHLQDIIRALEEHDQGVEDYIAGTLKSLENFRVSARNERLVLLEQLNILLKGTSDASPNS